MGMLLCPKSTILFKFYDSSIVKLFKFTDRKYHTINALTTMNSGNNFRGGRYNRFENFCSSINLSASASSNFRCNAISLQDDIFVSNSLRLAPPPPPPMIVTCGELRKKHEGKYVEMIGKFCNKRMGRFAELKDRYGATQLVITEDKRPKLARRLANMPLDSVLKIVGRVLCRPNSSKNESMPTGDIEVEVENILSYEMPKLHRSLQKRLYSTMVVNKTCGVTSTEYKMAKTENVIKWFDNREVTCNDLRKKDVGSVVQLVGWLSNLNASKFQHLKDGYGATQIIVEKPELFEVLKNVKTDSILVVKGKVVARPKSNINPKMDTGDIEVCVDEIRILDPKIPYDGPTKMKIQKLSVDDLNADHDSYRSNDNKSNENAISNGNKTIPDTNKFTYRTHNCGDLDISNCSQNVVICGWLEFQRMKKFVILRDGYGQVQCILPEHLGDKIAQIPFESILRIEGIVVPRPSDMRNLAMKTGDIEIQVTSMDLLNEADRNLPMDVRDFHRAKEPLRMEYRYIDLRFSDMQRNLRMRSTFLMKIREYLINYLGFVEVETPTLFRRTPGGAQEFVVPTRKAGHFYSLVQSPQQFKQMLMAGAIDRYFQIARCYRDETTRPDRQPEFTQLDIELSFTDRDSILSLTEEILKFCWPKELNNIKTPFPRMTYNEAMLRYGTDKPDTRFDLTLEDVSSAVNKFSEYQNFGAYAIIVRATNATYSTSLKKVIEEISKKSKCKFVAKKWTEKPSEWTENSVSRVENSISRLLSTECTRKLMFMLNIQKGDLLFLAFGNKNEAQTLLGRVRLAFIEYLEENDKIMKRKNDQYNFLWIVDFPMFTKNENGQIESTHHPFTACHPDDLEKLKSKSDLYSIKSLAYDLVLNGQEIAGGSMRIHNSDLQKFVLNEILQIDHSYLKHLLEALRSGCPPHGGIALGLDRVLSILCDTKSIRDVIAFPKGIDGKDHLSKAPLPITNEELNLYHLNGFTKIKDEK